MTYETEKYTGINRLFGRSKNGCPSSSFPLEIALLKRGNSPEVNTVQME